MAFFVWRRTNHPEFGSVVEVAWMPGRVVAYGPGNAGFSAIFLFFLII